MQPSSYVPQIISRLRIRNLLTYDDPANEDSGWIELGRRTLIVGPNGSGKTNIIRALRLLRAAVDLEEIRPAKVLNYLHDPSKPLAGIDLEVALSDEEAEAAYNLLRYYVEDSSAYLYDFGEHTGELKELLRNVRISMSWARKQHVDPSERTMGGYHELAFPDLYMRLLLQEGVEFHSSKRDIGFAYYDPDSWEELPARRQVPSGAKAACDKKELLERLLATLKAFGGEDRSEERKKALKDAMRSCAGEGVVNSHTISYSISYKETGSSISKILEMANISGPVTYEEHGMGYLLLRIILGGLLFAGSEKPLSGVSKLAALRGSFRSSDLMMDENSINEILDEVGASSASLDTYLRNVEPFLAHLSLSSDHEKKQRFRKISECFSKYFHNVKIDVALESYEVRLQLRPAPPQSEAQSPIDKAWDELTPRLQCVIKLQYPGIYLRENAGGREVEAPIDMAGQGHRELLSLLTALIGRPGSVVFLDEPASNMHPTLLSQFLMDLLGLGDGECSGELGRNQVVVITHSPAVAKLSIGADVSAPDLSIIRVRKNEGDGASGIQHLSPALYKGQGKEHEDFEDFLKDLRIVDPRVLFARGVVLCEGPADRAFLEGALRLSGKWNELLRNDVELVEMSGKNKLDAYGRVLEYLGISYVAILDFDALCDILLCKKEDEKKDHPLYNAWKGEEALVLTPDMIKNNRNYRSIIGRGYRYVLLGGNAARAINNIKDDNVLHDVCKKCGIKENCNKSSKSKKCELESFLKGLGMSLSYKDEMGETIVCTDRGKLKPESIYECIKRASKDVQDTINKIGEFVFNNLINTKMILRTDNAKAS